MTRVFTLSWTIGVEFSWYWQVWSGTPALEFSALQHGTSVVAVTLEGGFCLRSFLSIARQWVGTWCPPLLALSNTNGTREGALGPNRQRHCWFEPLLLSLPSIHICDPTTDFPHPLVMLGPSLIDFMMMFIMIFNVWYLWPILQLYIKKRLLTAHLQKCHR